jgi:hypothetical protein
MGSHLVNNAITIYYLGLIKTQLKYNKVLHQTSISFRTNSLSTGAHDGDIVPTYVDLSL